MEDSIIKLYLCFLFLLSNSFAKEVVDLGAINGRGDVLIPIHDLFIMNRQSAFDVTLQVIREEQVGFEHSLTKSSFNYLPALEERDRFEHLILNVKKNIIKKIDIDKFESEVLH